MRAARFAVADHVFEIVDAAEHCAAPARLTAIGARRRQQPDRPAPLPRAPFVPAQENLARPRTADPHTARATPRARGLRPLPNAPMLGAAR